jgi:toxin ParE1/3/4
MKVVFSPAANGDLEKIGDFIARDIPRRAKSFVAEIADLCGKIGLFPLGYEACPDLHPAIRRAVHGRYLIFYSVGEEAVRIERILHGARKIDPEQF